MSAGVVDVFRQAGGEFLTPPEQLAAKLGDVQALLFDWDGVFTDGSKDGEGHSRFSESDAMGVNLLRFAVWLARGSLPITAIITGETNPTAQALAQREHFDAVMPLAKNKMEVFERFCARFQLRSSQVLFCFDDVLDLQVATQCGVRLMIRHPGSLLLRRYVSAQSVADYITAASGGCEGLREACELAIGLMGRFDSVVTQRMTFSAGYQQYLSARNSVGTLNTL